jgi:uncharacterized membrane-anchored protein YhcB (DUF1043 family)
MRLDRVTCVLLRRAHRGHSDQGGRSDGVQVMVHRGYAYVGHTFSNGITILDVRDPKHPKVVDFMPCPPNTRAIHLQTHEDLLHLARPLLGVCSKRHLKRCAGLGYTCVMTSSEYQQLVEFLGRQFSEVDRRFSEVDRRFSEVDGRFSDIGRQFTELRQEMLGHFDAIYGRFERLEQEYQAITQALRRIEARLVDESGRREIIERDLAELKRHVATLQDRIEELEQRLQR